MRELRLRPSIALALSVALMLAVLSCSAPETDEPAPASSAPADGPGGEAPPADPVEAFAAFADRMPAEGAIDAAVLADGLRRLAGAGSAQGVIAQDVAVDLRANAEHVQLNPESIEVANTVRETLGAVTDALGDRLEDAGERQLRAATDAIAGKPLTGQAAALREYFQLTAAALAAVRG